MPEKCLYHHFSGEHMDLGELLEMGAIVWEGEVPYCEECDKKVEIPPEEEEQPPDSMDAGNKYTRGDNIRSSFFDGS